MSEYEQKIAAFAFGKARLQVMSEEQHKRSAGSAVTAGLGTASGISNSITGCGLQRCHALGPCSKMLTQHWTMWDSPWPLGGAEAEVVAESDAESALGLPNIDLSPHLRGGDGDLDLCEPTSIHQLFH